MDQTTGPDRQIAAAMAAEYESLSPRCRADAACLGRLLALDFHEFGSSGGESLWRRTADGAWQIFHHQGTPARG